PLGSSPGHWTVTAAAWVRGLLFAFEVAENGFRLGARDYRGKGCYVRLLHSLQAAEMFEEATSGTRANPANLQKFGRAVSNLASLAVKGHSEAVRLVADQLNQVQDWGVMIEDDWLILLTVHVDDLLPLGNGGQRLIDNLQRFERLSGRVQLPQASINQHEARHRSIFVLNALVATRNDLTHRGEVIHPLHRADDELAVVRLLHLTIFPDNHGSHGFGSLDVRDVEALNTTRKLGHAERILQRLLNRAGIRLHHPKALIV